MYYGDILYCILFFKPKKKLKEHNRTLWPKQCQHEMCSLRLHCSVLYYIRNLEVYVTGNKLLKDFYKSGMWSKIYTSIILP